MPPQIERKIETLTPTSLDFPYYWHAALFYGEVKKYQVWASNSLRFSRYRHLFPDTFCSKNISVTRFLLFRQLLIWQYNLLNNNSSSTHDMILRFSAPVVFEARNSIMIFKKKEKQTEGELLTGRCKLHLKKLQFHCWSLEQYYLKKTLILQI